MLLAGSVMLNATIGESQERSFIACIDLDAAGQASVQMLHEGKLQAETSGAKQDELGNRFAVILNGPADESGKPAPTLVMPRDNDRAYIIDLHTRIGRFVAMPKRATMYADRWMAYHGAMVWNDSLTGGLQRFEISIGNHQVISGEAPEGVYTLTPEGIYIFNGKLYFSPSLDKLLVAIPVHASADSPRPGELHLFNTHHWGLVGLNYDGYQVKGFTPIK